MSNKAYHDFILTKLNETIRSDNSIFGGEFLWSYVNGELTVKVPNTGTLLMDKKPLIPFVITAYDGERLPLALTTIKKYTMPIVFAIQYGSKVLWDEYIEQFALMLNGKTFEVDGVNVGFGVSINTQTGAGIQLKATDWINTTITVFAYEGNVFKGNDVIHTLDSLTAGSFVIDGIYQIITLGTTDWNVVAGTQAEPIVYAVGDVLIAKAVGSGTGTVGIVVEPLSYTSSMQNETSFATPNAINYGISKSNGKQHTRAYALLMTNELADTWIKEIEGDVLNTNYVVSVTYPYDPLFISPRDMSLDKGTVNSANGTALLLELIFIDA